MKSYTVTFAQRCANLTYNYEEDTADAWCGCFSM